MSHSRNTARLRQFIHEFSLLLAQEKDEHIVLDQGSLLLGNLIVQDDWLPEEYAAPHPERYQQYLLHADSQSRFSVVSFVWGPGQKTPIHDHTVWGLVGILRGAEQTQQFRYQAQQLIPVSLPVILYPGDIDRLSPRIDQDIHQVSNALADQTSVSIHVYGANIGAVHRTLYLPDGGTKPFISGYSNHTLPNIWDLSKES